MVVLLTFIDLLNFLNGHINNILQGLHEIEHSILATLRLGFLLLEALNFFLESLFLNESLESAGMLSSLRELCLSLEVISLMSIGRGVARSVTSEYWRMVWCNLQDTQPVRKES